MEILQILSHGALLYTMDNNSLCTSDVFLGMVICHRKLLGTVLTALLYGTQLLVKILPVFVYGTIICTMKNNDCLTHLAKNARLQKW